MGRRKETERQDESMKIGNLFAYAKGNIDGFLPGLVA